MELYQIRGFLALAETLNFTRAAERCGISQPSLSRAIRRLEEELGGPLVRRERGRTHLTELGQRVLPQLSQALRLTEQAQVEATRVANALERSMRVGVMNTIGPGRLISLFDLMADHVPELELKLIDAPGQSLVAMLLAEEVDVAILGMPSYPEPIRLSQVYQERAMVAFPEGHRFQRLAEVPYSALQEEPYLHRMDCEFLDHVAQVHFGGDLGLDLRHQSENESWIQAMVAAGHGCTLLPEHTPLRSGVLARPLTQPSILRPVSIATVRGRPHGRLVDLFSRLARCLSRREARPC